MIPSMALLISLPYFKVGNSVCPGCNNIPTGEHNRQYMEYIRAKVPHKKFISKKPF
jgi:hypothetical protein